MGVETFSAKASYWKLFGNIWIYLEIILILMLTTKHLAIIAYQDMELIRNFSTTEIKYKDYMQVAYIYGLINNFEGVSSFIAYLTVLRFF